MQKTVSTEPYIIPRSRHGIKWWESPLKEALQVTPNRKISVKSFMIREASTCRLERCEKEAQSVRRALMPPGDPCSKSRTYIAVSPSRFHSTVTNTTTTTESSAGKIAFFLSRSAAVVIRCTEAQEDETEAYACDACCFTRSHPYLIRTSAPNLQLYKLLFRCTCLQLLSLPIF